MWRKPSLICGANSGFFMPGGYQAKSLRSQEKTPFVLLTLISFIKESIDFVYRFD